jgi:CarD family transcriptional regulator
VAVPEPALQAEENTISEPVENELGNEATLAGGEPLEDEPTPVAGTAPAEEASDEEDSDIEGDDEAELEIDLDEIVPIPQIDFEIGDSVVYPHHGAGTVLKKEMKTVLGESREYLTLKILHNDMTVMVPTENAAVAGLRRVIDAETLQKVMSLLQDPSTDPVMNWNRRYKHNRDKIKTGDIYELAEVVRNLALRDHDKGLSTGEKQMYTRAKKVLSSEMTYALDMDEDQVDAHLTSVILEGTANTKPVPAAAE